MEPSFSRRQSQTQTAPFEFVSHSSAPGKPWKREGSGEAIFEWAGRQMTLEEKGTWWEQTPGAPKRHAFRKLVQLDKSQPNQITVRKHTPDEKLIELLTLERGENDRWTSPSPHVCIHDLYRAELFLDSTDSLHITWWSQGPEKNYDIRTVYQNASLIRDWLNS